MAQYSIVHDNQSDTDVMFKDGKNCICPFQNKILMPGQIQGSLVMQQFNCTSGCMFFDYYKEEKKVVTHCTKASFIVEEKEPSKLLPYTGTNAMA